MCNQRCYDPGFDAYIVFCLSVAAHRLHGTLIKHCTLAKPDYRTAMLVNYKAINGAAKAVS